MRKKLATFALGVLIFEGALADADGPDCYRVTGVQKGDTLALREHPKASAKKLTDLPPDADGLRNLGCTSDVSDGKALSLTPEQRKKLVAKRWCKTRYKDKEGWVKGSFLGEGTCKED